MGSLLINEKHVGYKHYHEYISPSTSIVEVGVNNASAYISLNGSNVLVSDGTTTTIEKLSVEEISFDLNPSPSSAPGTLFYDSTAQTLAATTGVPEVTVQIGQETHYQVINNTGVTIDNGTPVITADVDLVSGLVEIMPGNAVSPFTSLSSIGLTTEDIEDGQIGMVTNFGIVRDFDTSGLTIGRPVYLDTSSGGLTVTKPLSPNTIILIGTCLVSDSEVGQVHVQINRFSRPLANKSYSFTSNGIGAGTYYVGGFYEAPVTDVTLTDASLTQTHGTASVAYGAHAFIVAGGAGTVDTGQVGLRVIGDSVTDEGVLTLGDTEILVADITTLSTDDYVESPKKWIGTCTFELYEVSGSPGTYSIDFYYGYCKYEDFGNKDFTVNKVEVVGLAGGADTSFDIHFLKHDSTGWTYSAAAFDPGNGIIVDWSTDMSPHDNLANNENFAWKRSTLAEYIDGSSDEGIIVKIITGANNSVQSMDVHIVGEVESF